MGGERVDRFLVQVRFPGIIARIIPSGWEVVSGGLKEKNRPHRDRLSLAHDLESKAVRCFLVARGVLARYIPGVRMAVQDMAQFVSENERKSRIAEPQ